MEQIHQQYNTPYRPLQPSDPYALQGARHLSGNIPLDFGNIDPTDIQIQQQLRQLQSAANQQQYPDPQLYSNNHARGQYQQSQQSNGAPHTPQQQLQHQQDNGYLMNGMPLQHNSIARLQQQDSFSSPAQDEQEGQKSIGHAATRLEPDPPNLEEWRQRLFDVNEMITLSEEQYVNQRTIESF